MSALQLKGNVCKRCGKDLSRAVSFFGNEILWVHKQAHDRRDFKDLMKKWEGKVDTDFIDELKKILE